MAKWQARNDAGAAESFTPLTSDVVIAVGYRAPSSSGIDTLKSLVPDRPLPAGIRYGEGVTDIVFQPNIGWRTNQHPAGEMRLSAGVYRLPDGTERRVGDDLETALLTPFEPLARNRGDDSVGRFYVVSGQESATDRFSLTYRQEREQRAVLEAGFFLADWSESTGWRARNNEGDAEAFVPLATDVVVAMGHRATISSPGYDLLTPLVPKSALSPRKQVLMVDVRVDRLYRVEFARNLVTDAVDLGSIAPIKAASGIARVSDGVALIIDWQDDHLYRLEHTNEAVTSVTDLGSVSTVAGRQIAPEAITHLSEGVALIADNTSNRLYRVEYTDTSVTATTRLGVVSSRPFGMATIGPDAVLVADGSYDGLYRLDFDQSGFSRTRVGKVPGLTEASALAHVSEGVALLGQNSNPDFLFRVEYDSAGVNGVYSLGLVNGLWGLNGLTSLPTGTPGTNRAPSARDDSASTIEGVPVAIDVLANDRDDDGHALTVASVTQPSQGTAGIQSDGSVAYTPAAGFKDDKDSFSYAVSDGIAQATATVTVTVDERPLAVYDPDANTITVSEPGLVGDRFEVEETIGGVVTIHQVTSSTARTVTRRSASSTPRARTEAPRPTVDRPLPRACCCTRWRFASTATRCASTAW